LDAKVRQELRRWLRRLHSQIHVTSVFVTHDQEEALELADRVVVMNEGKIEQVGTPDAVVEHPETPFVMTFVGEVNIFHGRVQDGKALLGPLAVDYPAHVSSEARNAVGYARPHELELCRTGNGESLPATVRDVRIAGALVKVELVDSSDGVIQVEFGREPYERLHLVSGEKVFVRPKRMRVFTSD
jgi:sulfate transport system ATP-binding protein